nr:glycosyltransferase family 4 protein [Lentibacillus saliphilus]
MSQREKIKIGLVGSLNVDYKGHETVIKAINLIKDELPPFKIEFLGKGDPNRWARLIFDNSLEDCIDFIGTLPSGNKVYNWMDSLDLLLQPSSAEAQGRSIIEAMSRGCPIIASEVGGIVELLDKDRLIRPGDYKSLANKILNVISDKEDMINQAKKNYINSKQYYRSNIDKKRNEFLRNFKNSIGNK